MRPSYLRLRARPLLVGAVLALVAAALLVAYLQRRHEAEQGAQNELIRREMTERTAALLADRLRQEFEAAVVSTIESIDHADLRECRLPKIAGALATGEERHPFIDRFLFWNQRLPTAVVDQVVFYDPSANAADLAVPITGPDGELLGGLVVDPDLGFELLALAHSEQNRGRTLILAEREVRGSRYQVVMHTYGASRWPEDAPGIIGYIVNVTAVERHVLAEMLATELARLAPGDDEAPRLRFTLLDNQGEVAFGRPVPRGVPSGEASFDLAFFPKAEPAGWYASNTIHLPRWTVVISAEPAPTGVTTPDYLFMAVLGLISLALVCAVLVNRQSVRLSRLHADFVANVTHQLKTPLSLLSAASETLERERVRSPEKVSEYAALVGQQTASLTRLVERVLRLSQIDAGVAGYDFKPVDLVELVRDSVRRFGSSLPRSAIAISFDGPPDHVTVEADPSALEDVMENLLENAAKYTNGNGRIDVRVATQNGRAMVRVKDNGIGIEHRDLEHIFEKFYRGHGNGSRIKGFGVGLAIVENVVRAHQGQIHVDSEPGRGSEFEIVLPTLAEA